MRPFVLGDDPYAGGQHRGVDLGAAVGTPVRAPAGGTVSFAGALPGHGRGVTILTADGYAVTLLQLATTTVARGAAVAEGAVVGSVGASGDARTTAPHVHLGVRVAVEPHGYVDPLGLLPPREPIPVAPGPTAPEEPAGV
ncbi:MAG TPA: M23 family metallopeptidase, partial [Gaiellaceae bacterium]|nr:M23 family metallopeptidase [Gaiellaceae bacterium]